MKQSPTPIGRTERRGRKAGSLQSRTASIEALISPKREISQIIFVVNEDDSKLEEDIKRQRAMVEDQFKHGIEIDLHDVRFIKLVVRYESQLKH